MLCTIKEAGVEVKVEVRTDWGFVNDMRARQREIRNRMAELRRTLLARQYHPQDVPERKAELETLSAELRENLDAVDHYFKKDLPAQAKLKMETDAAKVENGKNGNMRHTGKTARSKAKGQDSKARKSERSLESQKIRQKMQSSGGKKG